MATALANSDLGAPSRAEIQRWIELGAVTVDGKVARSADKARPGSSVIVEPPIAQLTTATPDASVSFEVLHVDTSLVVVMKPAGLVVHPGAGHATGTLVHGLLARGWFKAEDFISEDGGEGHFRPGIVHRLDKGTSGIMVVARTAEAREGLKSQFATHTIERAYDAIVLGVAETKTHRTLHGRHPKDRVRFTTRVSTGKRAITHVRLVRPLASGAASLVVCTLETGRTHQIRVHLADSNTAVIGDPLYGRPSKNALVQGVADALGHQALHARVLGFRHPLTGQSMRFEADFPPDFATALEGLSS